MGIGILIAIVGLVYKGRHRIRRACVVYKEKLCNRMKKIEEDLINPIEVR